MPSLASAPQHRHTPVRPAQLVATACARHETSVQGLDEVRQGDEPRRNGMLRTDPINTGYARSVTSRDRQARESRRRDQLASSGS